MAMVIPCDAEIPRMLPFTRKESVETSSDTMELVVFYCHPSSSVPACFNPIGALIYGV